MKISTTAMLAAFALMASPALAAPLPYAGGAYAQDFNGLPTTGTATIVGTGPHDIEGQLGSTNLPGWTMSNYMGNGPDTEFRAQDGSLAGGSGRGVVSFGAAAASDRALGVLATSAQISRFGLTLVNNTSSTFTSFSLSFTGEQWRRGNVASPGDALTYDYAITASAAAGIGDDVLFTNFGSFTAPNTQGVPTEVALDGNLAANQIAVAQSVPGITWAPGQLLLLRWNGQDITGQDDGLAIDNLSFTAAVPEPTTLSLAAAASLVLAARRRR